ncbi:PilN domain-containing protein [Pseudomonas aegrilactucae]|uniref:PilN domain-containing protein n=1 Tax=Pseudomonas aegrilactucae TaxID=2854028 RepID=A0A9Q2XLC1_9PSED|nr:PilN domain-containing protein [Pseudomonas aegrilactucae]
MRHGLNLLPWREWRRQRGVRQLQGLLLATLLLAIVGLVLLDRQASRRLALQGLANAQVSDAIARLQAPVAQVNGLAAQGDALLQRAQVLEALQHAASPGAQVLGLLARRVPPGVQLTALALEGNALRLEGVAQGRASVTRLMSNLGQSPGLADIRLQEVKATATGEVFQMSAQVRP